MRAIVIALCLGGVVLADARFTEPPKVTGHGTAATISFAVSAPTDVEVAVVDAAGRVVRHLGAGALGPNAPAPFKPRSLRQALLWDRTDDAHRPVAGACTVRVGLGLTGKPARHIGFDPYAFRTIVGLAVNAKGELFVLDAEFAYGASGIRVYDSGGAYLRTIMPYSSSLPARRVASIGQLRLADGRRVPIVYNAHGQNLHPYTSGMKHQTMAIDPAGRLVLLSAVGTIVEHRPPRHVLFLAPDGGAPETGGFVGPPIRKGLGFMGGSAEGFVRYFDHVAVSGDGKWLYVSGGRFASPQHMRHAVARVAPGQTDLPKAWLGQYDKPGDDETHLNDPQGVAVDAAGCVYVADRGNGRVVVCSPEGKRLGQFALADPLQVFVHPRGGWIYVSAGAADSRGRMKAFTLHKLSPFRPGGAAPKELARVSGVGMPLVALDPTADPPKLWLAMTTRAGQELLGVIDRGETLELGKGLGAGREQGLSYPMFLAADAPHGKLYVTEFRNRQVQFDLKTARMTPFARGGETAVDAEGFVYVIEGYPPRVFLHRYGRDGKPASFPGTDSAKIGPIDTASKGPHVGFRGHTIAPNGDLYILQMKFYGRGRVVVYDRAGKCKTEALVEGIPNGGAGVAVDRAGCVYVSTNVKPAERPYPDDFAPLLPKKGWVWWRRPRPAPWDRPYYNAYLYHWGSVFKFPAAGGRFYPGYKELGKDGRPPAAIPEAAARYRTGYLNADVGVVGALWRHHGLAPIPSSALNWGDPSCTCLGARFSLDGFGRLFVPDVFRFGVNVLDSGGNLITRLGRYGNADDPGLSLAWAAYASVSGGTLFLSDMANRRVSIVGLAPATVAAAPIPAGR